MNLYFIIDWHRLTTTLYKKCHFINVTNNEDVHFQHTAGNKAFFELLPHHQNITLMKQIIIECDFLFYTNQDAKWDFKNLCFYYLFCLLMRNCISIECYDLVLVTFIVYHLYFFYCLKGIQEKAKYSNSVWNERDLIR